MFLVCYITLRIVDIFYECNEIYFTLRCLFYLLNDAILIGLSEHWPAICRLNIDKIKNHSCDNTRTFVTL